MLEVFWFAIKISRRLNIWKCIRLWVAHLSLEWGWVPELGLATSLAHSHVACPPFQPRGLRLAPKHSPGLPLGKLRYTQTWKTDGFSMLFPYSPGKWYYIYRWICCIYCYILIYPGNCPYANSSPKRHRHRQAVALDPALPLAVRLQLINSRRDLRSKAWDLVGLLLNMAIEIVD